ncbi:MAG: hypothetical protein H7A23_26140 [Leptospiraceae bacterium]|nr:hypothetical protein [Leptospiraceae bacterium]MCP5498051.1 hypothetical protein [Leptospiraceae bacterium]
MKSFESWTFEDVQNTFGITRSFKDSSVYWVTPQKQPNQREKETIEILKILLRKYVDTWNEDEIKFHFIGPFLSLINFTTDNYKSFTQRTLHLKTEKVETSGRVDMMVCTGIQKPQHPFFFFNEYKPSKRGINDPLGQLLIEMITGLYLNENKFPMYGAYTEGRFWYFVVLDKSEYIISHAFDASEDEIYEIYSVLCNVKDYIEGILATINLKPEVK